MSISVTPIPRLTTFGAPAFTLGTANAAGDSATAVASNSTLALANAFSCRVYNDAAQSVDNDSSKALAFNSERFDNGTLHDTVTNNSRITFAYGGVYYYGGNVNWGTTGGTGFRQITIRLNGSTTITQAALDGDALDGNPRQIINGLWEFDADDYIELLAYQNSGGAININSNDNFSPEFWASRII